MKNIKPLLDGYEEAILLVTGFIKALGQAGYKKAAFIAKDCEITGVEHLHNVLVKDTDVELIKINYRGHFGKDNWDIPLADVDGYWNTIDRSSFIKKVIERYEAEHAELIRVAELSLKERNRLQRLAQYRELKKEFEGNSDDKWGRSGNEQA